MSRQSRKLLVILIIIELYFLLPLLVSAVAWYNAMRAMRTNNVASATLYTKLASPFFQLSEVSYQVARPALWVVQMHSYTDRMMRVARYVNDTALVGTESAAHVARAFPLVLKSAKTAEDQQTLNSSMRYLRTTLPTLTDKLFILSVETQNPQLKELHNLSRFFETAVRASDSMGGTKKEGRFLLLFLNDKELRPGGGFIGSYGIATFGHYSLRSFEIHDVYDADGQLTEHVDPPAAVRDYLKNPHWFLRDSNMSPDFKDNALRAEWFLARSLGAPPFDGVIALTTNTIEQIIGAYGSLSLPNGEVITKDTFYEKTQDSVHENFFPGSRQKQTTLSTLAQTMILEFDRVPKEHLGTIVKEMLTQKELVAFTKDEPLQAILEEFGWAGRMKKPRGDYLYPVESNVGVNKVNRFVTRRSSLEVRLSSERPTKHVYTVTFNNTYNGPDPSGNMYKNYFQLYIPQGSVVQTVLFDGVTIGHHVYTQTDYVAPTVHVEVPPQASRTLTIIYTTPNVLSEGIEQSYELIVQKQTGVPPSSFSPSFILEHGSSLLSHNFDATIRGNTVSVKDILKTDTEYRLNLIVP